MVGKLPKFALSAPAAEPMAAGHLATVAAEIADAFPLVLDHTSLVLLDLDPNHLHAFWTLAPEDRHRAGAAFRAGGAAPELVIQLRRLNADGSAEVLTRRPLAEGPRGDARFDLDNDDATYQAEIGLGASDGGWLLLARSNQARLPRSVGVLIPVWDGEAPAGPEGLDPWVEPGLPGPDSDPAAGAAPIPLTLEDQESRLFAPTDEPRLGHLSVGVQPPSPLGEGLGVRDRRNKRLDPPHPSPLPLGGEGAERLHPTRPEPSPMARPEPPGPLSSFAVGRGPGTPVIEAEVLVHVSAMPGTLVDLYGRPVRVGPSGRTTVRLPVTDLALLSALLAPSAGSEEGSGNP